MTAPLKARYRGVFPVVPTTFTESGELDIDSQKRCVDFMIDAGSNGICILANFSEQFVLSDAEREVLTTIILRHVAGRVPVIVTTTHFSSRVCAERSKRAQDEGAAMQTETKSWIKRRLVLEEKLFESFIKRAVSSCRTRGMWVQLDICSIWASLLSQLPAQDLRFRRDCRIPTEH